MSDFDDLLSAPRRNGSSALPVFDNPFQDVFEGVSGRARDPDPWSTGGWGETEPTVAASTFQSTFQSAVESPPVSPGGFKEFQPAQSFIAHEPEPESPVEALTSSVAQSVTHEEEKPPQANVDPLGSDLQEPEEPVKRNPLGPLPSLPRLPSLPPSEPKPSEEEGPGQATPPASSPAAPLPVVVEPASSPVTRTEPQPTSPEKPRPSVSSSLDSSQALARVIPPIPPSPLTPHPPPTPTSSSEFSTGSNRDRSASGSLSADSHAQLESSPSIKYDRIVSPLETPPAALAKRSSLEQGFSNLALGGEVSGWGGPVHPSGGFSATEPDQGGFGSNGFDVKTVHEGEPETSPSQSVTTVQADGEEETEESIEERPAPEPSDFLITVGDPQKVGDPLSAHIVYTVHTKTTAPGFSKSTFSVLRRYSDFLWLYEALSANNPGVIVPPVPEKNPFGRFDSDFVESRRLGLNKCLQKIANHPVLSKDEDFRFFLESDSFALDIKHRRAEGPQNGGLLSTLGSFTAPRFYEVDEWFDHKRAYLDALESQLKALVKAIEMVSKQRAEFAVSISEFADTIAALSMSDLSKQLTNSLSVLADVERLYKSMQDDENKADLVTIMGTADEYSRLINSVRLAFNSRVKTYFNSQNADSEVRRIKSAHEKARRQGRTTGSMVEIAEAERRALMAKREFDEVTKLIKLELARFETERVEDFKVALEQFLDGMITRQKELIKAWENYQSILLKRVAANPSGDIPDGSQPEQAEDI